MDYFAYMQEMMTWQREHPEVPAINIYYEDVHKVSVDSDRWAPMSSPLAASVSVCVGVCVRAFVRACVYVRAFAQAVCARARALVCTQLKNVCMHVDQLKKKSLYKLVSYSILSHRPDMTFAVD